MVTRIDREATRRELIRLLDGLEFYRSWRLASIRAETGEITEEDRNQIVMPGSVFLQLFDDTKGATGLSILGDVQQWYAHTARDFRIIASQNTEARGEIDRFLDDFRNAVGFDFHGEAGFLRDATRAALQRGRIASREEYDALKATEDDPSPFDTDAAEMSKIAKLLRAFEHRNRGT